MSFSFLVWKTVRIICSDMAAILSWSFHSWLILQAVHDQSPKFSPTAKGKNKKIEDLMCRISIVWRLYGSNVTLFCFSGLILWTARVCPKPIRAHLQERSTPHTASSLFIPNLLNIVGWRPSGRTMCTWPVLAFKDWVCTQQKTLKNTPWSLSTLAP